MPDFFNRVDAARHIAALLLEGFFFEAALKIHYGHLVPAIRVGGKIFSGNKREDHFTVIGRMPSSALEKLDDVKEKDYGFLDVECGKFHPRHALGGLQSHELAQMQGH